MEEQRKLANAWLDEESPNIVERGIIAGHRYWIAKSPGMIRQEHSNDPKIEKILRRISDECGYNGYIHYPKRPLREKGYKGLVDYVPVWGGVTYAQEDINGMVYGFDTGHINQENLPIRDTTWIKKQIRAMKGGIDRAKKVEAKYLRAMTNKGKAPHIAYVFGKNKPMSELGFGALINLLGGKL